MVCSAKLVDKQLKCFLGQWEGMVSKFLLGSSSGELPFLIKLACHVIQSLVSSHHMSPKKVSKIRQFAEVESYRILVFCTISKQQ